MKDKNTYLIRLFTLLLSMTFNASAFAQCEDDTVAPVAICVDGLQAMSVPGEGVTIWADDINEGSYDDCSSVILELVLATDDTGTPPGTVSVTLPDVAGEYLAVLYAIDQAGNVNSCFTTITLLAGCTEDEEEPTIICINGLTVTVGIFDQTAIVYATDLIHDATDNCDLNLTYHIELAEGFTGQPPGQDFIVITDEHDQTLIVYIWAEDDAGNATYCETYLLVQLLYSCETDTNIPTAICDDEYSVAWTPVGGATVTAADIDEGSYDLCSAVDLEIVLITDDTGMPPGTEEVSLMGLPGAYVAVLYAIDEAGNFNTCFTTINTVDVGEGCDGDIEDPNLICIAGLTATLDINGTRTIYASDFVESLTDNCDFNPEVNINLEGNSTGEPSGLNSLTFDAIGIYALEVWAVDAAGNATFCVNYVIIQDNFNCDQDITPPVMICEDILEVEALAGEGAVISVEDINNGTYDFCGDLTLSLIVDPVILTVTPDGQMVTLPPVYGTYLIGIQGVDEAENEAGCMTIVEVTGIYYSFEGQVFIDNNNNCTLDGNETDLGLGGWTVRATHLATGQQTTTQTAADGTYQITALNNDSSSENDFEIEVIMLQGMGASCPTSILLQDVADLTSGVNFPIQLVEDCTYLTVDVSASFLRRCFPNQYYVNYFNYSNFAVDNANIVVQLDPTMEILSASIPYTDLGNGQLFFDLGTLPAGTSGQFSLTVQLGCDTPLGATHCVEATILPFTCIPDDSFAELTVTGECDPTNDEVNFTITNVGESTMISPRTHIIIEDVVMYMTGDDPLQLDAGEETSFNFPANGATWRLTIEQDESFPFGGVAAAFVEGCGGFTPNMATQFSLTSSKPNVSQDCQEDTGAWDPNDKQAFPRGYGEQNFLEANTAINYHIRFQNTGTDTAFNVRVEDQLSEYLDYTTIVPGASSHAYRMELKEDGLLTFHFDNIMLPDSNVNQIGSNGFVKFEIQQMRDNPLGSVIENSAAIFFDFNEPVITNTVHHTIGEDFVMVGTQNILKPGVKLTVAPNPLHTFTTLRLEGYLLQDGYCQVYDAHGRLVHQMTFNGQEVQLDRANLGSAGLYFYRILDQDQMLVQGKLIVE